MDKQGQGRDKQGQGRDKQGQDRNKKGQPGEKGQSLYVPYFPFFVPAYTCLSCLSLSVPVWAGLGLAASTPLLWGAPPRKTKR